MIGTWPLWVILALAIGASRSRPRPIVASPERRGVLLPAGLAIGAQSLHVTEELVAGFPERYPRVLGLDPWSGRWFLAFNVGWLVVWILAIAATSRGVRGLEWALWFLAFALLANAAAHPALSVWSGDYFPGLLTAPVVGVAGAWLCWRLLRITSRTRAGR